MTLSNLEDEDTMERIRIRRELMERTQKDNRAFVRKQFQDLGFK